MKTLLRAFLVSLLFLTPMIELGCNTVKGVGRDIEAGGEAIEDVAEDASE